MYRATVAVEKVGNAGYGGQQICLHEVEAETPGSLIQKINNVLGASLEL